MTSRFVISTASAGTAARSQNENSAVCTIITDELKHCQQSLLSYGSVAVYLFRGQAHVGSEKKGRDRERDYNFFPLKHSQGF